MTELIIIRHAQSESNGGHFFAAQTNVNLTELGRRQAQATAEFLKDVHIDVAYSSNLVRVIQTAKPTVNGRNIPFIITRDLIEINGGEWEGLGYKEIREKYPAERDIWDNDFPNAVCPSGESVVDVYNRIKVVFDRIARENDGKTVLVATHAVPIRVMSALFMGLPFQRLCDVPWAKNASVTRARYDNGKWNLELFAYSDHFEKLGIPCTG